MSAVEGGPPPVASLVAWDIPPGTELAGRFTVVAKVAEGAVASVYRAEDRLLGGQVALKVLDPLRGADPVGRARFQRELAALSRLSHPGIGRALGMVEEGELEVLVLEWVEGETLRGRIDRGRLPVAEAVEIAAKIAEALAACHAQGILHRDLKPENIVLHPDRGPVVLDFGLAWFSAAATLTRTGAMVGTVMYLAPEALRSSLHDVRADLYALGAILFEMLSGAPLRSEGSVTALALSSGEPPSIFHLRAEVGPELSAIVSKSVAPRAEERFATALELARALRSRRALGGKALEARLPCPSCGTPRILDLPICPGCGAPVAWDLQPGPYAVQLDRVEQPPAVVRWLEKRYPQSLKLRRGKLELRLRYWPVPLAVGISKISAEQLAAEASRARAESTIVHTRRLSGPRLKASAAGTTELLWTVFAHFGLTVLLGLLFRVFGAPRGWEYLIPPGVAVALLVPIVLYVRRPLLQPSREPPREVPAVLGRIAARLEPLRHERSRRLAAQLIARAAPQWIGDRAGLPTSTQQEIDALAERAIDALVQGDALLDRLLGSSRARLDPAEHEKRDLLTDDAIAYDLTVRTVLDACERISDLAATRTTAHDVARLIGER